MEPRPHLPRPRRPWRARPGVSLFAGLIVALTLIHLFTQVPVNLGGFRFQVGARFDRAPKTLILIPPVGEIRARTHSAPVSFHIVLWSIDMEVVHSLLTPGQNPVATSLPREIGARLARPHVPWTSIDEFSTALAATVRHAAQWLLVKGAALGLGGGILGAVAVGGLRPARRWLAGGAAGLLSALLLLLPAYATYDTRAFGSARYTGIMEAAPWMLEAVRESLGRVEELGDRLRTIAANLYTLFERIDRLEELGLPPADLVVLHISDVHNNPAALDLVQSVARRFAVDLVIDTGDLTDWATSLEAELVKRVGALDLPYFITPGNHESPLVVEKLRATPNVRVLQDELITVMGLRLYGFADPGASSPSPRSMTPQEAQRRAEAITAAVAALGEPVDIIAVHNHRVAGHIPDGFAQAILFGHSHRLAVESGGSTVRINAGTTGAAGIRGLQSSEPVPYSLVILYFSRQSPPGGDTPAPRPGTVSDEGGASPVKDALPAEDVPGPSGSLRLQVIDTIRVFAHPTRGVTLERIALDTP